MRTLFTRADNGGSSQLSDCDLNAAARRAGYRLTIHGAQDYRLFERGSMAPFLRGDKAAIASRLGLASEPRRAPRR